MRVAIMASGRGSNFEALLRSTQEPGHPAEIVVLVSDREEAAALSIARAQGVETLVIDPGTRRGPWTDDAVASLLRALSQRGVEAICLAGFMRILPAEVVRAYPLRILNIHPSLLPSFPGVRAHRQVLKAGVKVTGCTVHLVDEGVDTGPIVAQRAVPVEPDDDEDTLAARVIVHERELYPEALRALAENRVRIEGRVARVLEPSSARGQ